MKAYVVTHGEYSDTQIIAAFSSLARAEAWVGVRTDIAAKASGKVWYDGHDYAIEEIEFDPPPREGPRQHDLRSL
jgi:hypothetical protein